MLGAPASVPAAVASALATVPCVVLGPGASVSPFRARVAIDTGVAGIHEGGIAMRMDEVPLPLRPSVSGPISAAAAARALRERLPRRSPGAAV